MAFSPWKDHIWQSTVRPFVLFFLETNQKKHMSESIFLWFYSKSVAWQEAAPRDSESGPIILQRAIARPCQGETGFEGKKSPENIQKKINAWNYWRFSTTFFLTTHSHRNQLSSQLRVKRLKFHTSIQISIFFLILKTKANNCFVAKSFCS